MIRLLIAWGLAVGLTGSASAGELGFELSGGDHLAVRVDGAEKQTWKVFDRSGQPEIIVAALIGERLIVEEFSWPFGPSPKPEPEPQPIPGPKVVLWIEESADRSPGQAAAIVNKEIRQAIQVAGWQLRIVDDDVVDETGESPGDLAAYITAARAAGLPRVFILQDGKELYAGAAPPDASSFAALLSRFGLVVGPTKEAGPPSPGVQPQPNREQSCPTGQCPPTPQPTTRRWRIFR